MAATVGVRRIEVVNAMSVDVEDYFHVNAFDGVVPRANWVKLESRVCRNTERLLALFEASGVTATFFVLVHRVRGFPALLDEIMAAGHEIALHGHDHTRLTTLTPTEAGARTRAARAELEDYGITLKAPPANEPNKPTYAYVPLQLVTDDRTGARVAFSGRMLYRPGAAGWGGAHRTRLTWLVQMLVDVCQGYSGSDCDDYTDAGGRDTRNQAQVVHTYYDSWRLTSIKAPENRGTDYALIYEVVYYVLAPEYNLYMDVQQAINLALLRGCAERGIDFAYPTQRLQVTPVPPGLAA